VGSEGPLPEEGVWEVQTILKLTKGTHELGIIPTIEPRDELDSLMMELCFRKLVPANEKFNVFRIVPIEKKEFFRTPGLKLVRH